MIFPLTCKKPILLVGNGARASGAVEEIREFHRKTKIPVLTSLNTVDIMPDDERIGFIGTYGNRAANMVVAECDLIIAVGIRLGLRQIGKKAEKFAPKAKLIRVDIDQFELGRTIKEDEEKHLIDAKAFMKGLLQENVGDYTDWYNKCVRLRDYLEGYDDEIGNLTVKKVADLLPTDSVVAVDIGQNMCWTAQSLVLKGDNSRILIGGSYGSMGCGLPYAIGASISDNNGKVYCITGDGGLQMNIQELETVKRESLPIKILVLNNHTLGKISEVQEVSYGARFAQTTAESGYSVPNFAKISVAYGIKAIDIDSYEDLENYKDWLYDNDPCLININLPGDTKLIPKIEFKSMEILPQLDLEILKKCQEILS